VNDPRAGREKRRKEKIVKRALEVYAVVLVVACSLSVARFAHSGDCKVTNGVSMVECLPSKDCAVTLDTGVGGCGEYCELLIVTAKWDCDIDLGMRYRCGYKGEWQVVTLGVKWVHRYPLKTPYSLECSCSADEVAVCIRACTEEQLSGNCAAELEIQQDRWECKRCS